MEKNNLYTLGIDIGIASIGWSLIKLSDIDLSPEYLLDAGVRIFRTAETPKTGESLATKRREARSARRRLRRRGKRLGEVKALLIAVGFISNVEELNTGSTSKSPWEIRAKAIHERVSDIELSRVILHIAKRRGFKSNRKAEKTSPENSVYYKAFSTQQELLNKYHYETIGELVYSAPEFESKKRNSNEAYISLSQREDLRQELILILNKQRELGNTKVSNEFIDQIIQITQHQLPFATKEKLKALVGRCTFFPDEERLTRASKVAHEFIFWQKINNLNLRRDNNYFNPIPLTLPQKESLISHVKSHKETSFAAVRTLLSLIYDEATSTGYFFKDLKYTQRNKEGNFLTVKEIEKTEKFCNENYFIGM